MDTILELRGVCKRFGAGTAQVRVLDGIDLDIPVGSVTVVVGPSGAGKSTLLNVMGGLDRPTEGCVRLAGEDLAAMPEDELTLLRRRRLGFVFQFFNLLPAMPAWQNIALPLLLDGMHPRDARAAALALGEQLGLGAMLERESFRLSGGEMQRVAVARALIHDPVLVLADEPTGNLDSMTGQVVMELLCEGVRRRNRALVMVTHDPSVLPRADRVIRMVDGRIVHA